jgi:hypothetical protein
MRTQIKAVIAFALCMLLVGIAFATVFFTKTLTGNIIITASVGIEVYQEQARTTITTTLTFPSFDKKSTSEVYSQVLYLKNTGSQSLDGLYCKITASGMPSGITVSFDWSDNNGATWSRFANSGAPSISTATFNADCARIVLTPSGSQLSGTTSLTVNFDITNVA